MNKRVAELREKERVIVAELEAVREEIQAELAWAWHAGELTLAEGGVEVWNDEEEGNGPGSRTG